VVLLVVWLLLTVIVSSFKLPPLEDVKLLPVPVVLCVSVLRSTVSNVGGPVAADFVCFVVWIDELATGDVVEIIAGILLPVIPTPVFSIFCVDEVVVFVTALVCVLAPDVDVDSRDAVFSFPVFVFSDVLPTLLPGELDVEVVGVEMNLQK